MVSARMREKIHEFYLLWIWHWESKAHVFPFFCVCVELWIYSIKTVWYKWTYFIKTSLTSLPHTSSIESIRLLAILMDSTIYIYIYISFVLNCIRYSLLSSNLLSFLSNQAWQPLQSAYHFLPSHFIFFYFCLSIQDV